MLESFRRDKHSGVYWAYGETYGYSIAREKQGWVINVRLVIETAGVRHTLGQPDIYGYRTTADTLALAKDIVRHFDADPQHVMYEAVSKAYAAERKRWTEGN